MWELPIYKLNWLHFPYLQTVCKPHSKGKNIFQARALKISEFRGKISDHGSPAGKSFFPIGRGL